MADGDQAAVHWLQRQGASLPQPSNREYAMRPISEFERIKSVTNGYLAPETYQAIYEAALTAPAGDVLDIGPAQGGSTISLGLGRRDAGQAGVIYSVDRFTGSAALADKHDVNANVEAFRSNISEFDLLDTVQVILADTSDDRHIGKDVDLAAMFVDADGALDRDFRNYYDNLVPGAEIILDDYADKVNSRGRRMIQLSSEELESYRVAKGEQHLRRTNLLGKPLTVFRLSNVMFDNKLLIKNKIVGQTIFARVPRRKPAQSAIRLAFDHFDSVRAEIEQQFYAMRESAD